MVCIDTMVVSYVDDNTIVRIFPANSTPEQIFAELTQHLKSWRKILQITGGDLDITKSNCSIMKWKRKGIYGTPQLMNKKELPGTITVTSTLYPNSNPDSFQRLEPWEATRVLGIRIPMTGQMNHEKKYRKKQMKEFGTKLYSAPLTHQESYIAYETRYKPMIRYPLQVTTFTAKECTDIQKIFMHKLLPKIGFNRNTPRSIIYGPRYLGGREMMDLRNEQALQQWKNTIGHMRRMDAVGKALQITLHDHQIEIGSASSFLEKDPTVYNYGTKNTKWEYLWKSTAQAGLKIDLHEMWLPKNPVCGDLNIMDRAVIDPSLIKEQWKLQHINHCRLYLQAFNLSDLTNKDGKLIRGFLNGTLQRRHAWINFPVIQIPTKAQWAVWKGFMSRNFLRQGYTIYPLIQLPLEKEMRQEKPITEVMMIRQLYIIPGTVSEKIDLLPTQLKLIMGTVKGPKDKGIEIRDAIINGNCKGASDGSLVSESKKKWGGHGFLIQTDKESTERYEGFATTPSSDSMTSQTTEHYGLLGNVILLHCICSSHDIKSEDNAKIVLYIDNKEVGERGNRNFEPQNVSEYLTSDADLWALTSKLIKCLPIIVEIQWIKSHQDTNSDGQTKNGPFLLPVQMNIDSDTLASKGISKGLQIRRATYSTTAISFRTEEGQMIENFHQHLTLYVNGKEIKTYYEARRGWNPIIINKIDWDGLEATLNTYNPIKNNHIIQLMHDWQNVGKQVARFRNASKDKIATLCNEEEWCPMGCKK